MALKGNPRTLAALKRAIKAMPITAAARIAARAAPEMTGLARGAFDSGQTVYDTSRPRGVDGGALSLEKSGATRRAMQFVATGRDMRLTSLPRYAKYLIGPARPGKHYAHGAAYGILPNGPLPLAWRERITDIAAQVLHDQIFGGGGA